MTGLMRLLGEDGQKARRGRVYSKAGRPQTQVYFVQAGQDGPIKIGFALDLQDRLKTLQVGSPVELHLLGSIPGDVDFERRLHDRFRHLRVRGEWFRADPELLTFIDETLANDTSADERIRLLANSNGFSSHSSDAAGSTRLFTPGGVGEVPA